MTKSDMLLLGDEDVLALRDAVLDTTDGREDSDVLADNLRGLAQAGPGREIQLMWTANSAIRRVDWAECPKAAAKRP